MSTFTSRIEVAKLSDGNWELLEDFEFWYAYGDKQIHVMTALAGFVTNFGTIPRILWLFISPTDDFIAKPSVIHDDGYATPQIDPETGEFYTRKKIDQLFLYGMFILGAKWWQLTVVYIAVRLFGMFKWDYAIRKQPTPRILHYINLIKLKWKL